MGARVPVPGRLEFRVNYKFNSELQVYWDRNKSRFNNNFAAAKQHLFEVGLKRAVDNKGLAARTLATRNEFLDPRRKSVSIIVGDGLRAAFATICSDLSGSDEHSAASVVLRIGYHVEMPA